MAKKIAAVLLVITLLLGGAGYWLWTQLTALPEWYGGADMIAEDGSPQVDLEWVQIPSTSPSPAPPQGAKDEESSQGGKDGEVYQLRNPHLRSRHTRKVDKAIKASRVQYAGGEFEGGAVLNLADMDVDAMSAKDRDAYDDITQAFPALMGRDVYVGIEGAGRTEDGKVVVGSKTRLRVGETRYTVAKAAKRLGMSEAKLRKQIEKELGKADIPPPPK